MNVHPWGGRVRRLGRQTGRRGAAVWCSLVQYMGNWGDTVAAAELGPGMIAIFRLTRTDIPEVRSRLLVGVVVRRQNCVEVVLGKVADRVVLSCVAADSLTDVRRPPLGLAGE